MFMKNQFKTETVTTYKNKNLLIKTFDTFDDLKIYWLENFDYYHDQNIKTKVIGKTLIEFQREVIND